MLHKMFQNYFIKRNFLMMTWQELVLNPPTPCISSPLFSASLIFHLTLTSWYAVESYFFCHIHASILYISLLYFISALELNLNPLDAPTNFRCALKSLQGVLTWQTSNQYCWWRHDILHLQNCDIMVDRVSMMCVSRASAFKGWRESKF